MAEFMCGIYHKDLYSAISCARSRLGLTRETEHPLVGTKTNRMANLGQIIGFTDSTGLKRWRVDWDPVKKVHVNEEDHSERPSRKVCHQVMLSSEEWVIRWWRKFTVADLGSYPNQPVARNRADEGDDA
jgi:hypothetical protein